MSNDTLIGGPGDDTIDGGPGVDRLFGLADNDSLLGGIGDDSLYGDGGDDVLRGGEGYDLLAGGTGNDTLEGGEGGDYQYGGDQIFGGEGRDVAIYAGNKVDYQWSKQEGTDYYGNFVSYWSVVNPLTNEYDQVWDVEVLRFNDGDVVIVPPPATLKRVSLDVSGVEQSQPSLQPLAWSADGTEVAFRSAADLLGNGTATLGRIYAKNVDTGAVRALDAPANGQVLAVSPDLTHLYYQDTFGGFTVGPADGSSATTIQDGTYIDPNGTEWTVQQSLGDVFLTNGGARIAYSAFLVNFNYTNSTITTAQRWVIRDIASGNVLFVEDAAGLPASGSGVYYSNDVTHASISADGDTAVFAKPAGTPGFSDITVWDVNSGSLLQTISGISYLNQIDISADGGTIAFVAYDPTNYNYPAFVTAVGGSPAVAVRNQWGSPVSVDSIDLSADGSVLAFTSADYGLPGWGSGNTNAYRLELATGLIMLASTDVAGGGGNGQSLMPLLSPDGQRLAFQSDASNLDPNDTNSNTDIFVFDTIVIGDPTPTITGSDDPVVGDVLVGTPSADVVAALRGDDVVETAEGNDLVMAGLGNDTAYGGDGNDELRGEGGDDYLGGGEGDDTLLGGDESDTLEGGAGNDKLYGGDARTIYGQNTSLYGSNYLYGGDGNDELYGGGGDDHLYPGPGNDTVDGGVSDNYRTASDSHNNSIDYSYGYVNTSSGVVVNLANGTATDPDGGHDTLRNINGVTGTENDDTLIGNDDLNTQNNSTYLYGRGGNDVLQGGSAWAWLDGDEGDDTLTLGGGGGYLSGGRGNDVLKGGTGFDTAYFSFYHYGSSGPGLTITLLAPGTGLTYQSVSDGQGGTDQLYDNIEGLYGSYFNDVLTGNSVANIFYSWEGDDTVTGGGGNDTVYGGGGTDTAIYAGISAGYQITNTYSYVFQGVGYAQWQVTDINLADGDDGSDSVWTGSNGDGTELLQFADGTFLITAVGTPDGDLIYGGSNSDTLNAGGGNDQIFAGGGDDSVHGGSGNDTLNGEGGDDFLEGDDGDDVIFGGAGNDYIVGDSGLGDDLLYGEAGDDTLIGHAGNDLLSGDSGNDSLDGGEDDDVLIGGVGNDTLVGGDGNDTAAFSGVKTGYLVEVLTDGRTTVTDIDTSNGDDGTDTLEGVETLQFAPDPNQAPTAVALTNTTASLAENTSTSSPIKVADIAISDDGLGTNSISLLGDDAAAFEVIGTALYLKAGTSLDYETKTAYSVTVSVLDSTIGGSSPVSTDYSLAVTNLNEAPTALILSATAFSENIPAGSLVASLSSSDPDTSPQSFSYALAAGAGDTDNSAFFITGNELHITNLPDYEVKSSYGIRLKTTDQGGLSFERNVTLTVNDLPDSPSYSFSSSSALVYEGGALALAVRSSNAAPGTRIYWSFSGTGITSVDLSDGILSGTSTLGADGGAGFTKTIAADGVVEGDEGLEVKFFSDIARTQQLGSTIQVTIKEPSVGDVTDGRDNITGSAEAETISGVPTGSTQRGRGTVDKLTGGGGNDNFVLADASGVFYDDGNATVSETKDMAWITDFSAGDKIILSGSSANYRLSSAFYSSFRGVLINALLPASTPEPIGFVQSATLAALNLANPDQFIYLTTP